MIQTGLGIALAVTDSDLAQNETLIFNRSSGFTWVRQARNDDPTDSRYNWNAKCSTAREALDAARAAGFNPTAIYYPKNL